MAKSFYVWLTIFALTSLAFIAGLISSDNTMTGNVTAITGDSILNVDQMYSLSWVIVVSLLLISAYIVFVKKRQ